jgi:ABC-type transporter Mla subunit MlaD
MGRVSWASSGRGTTDAKQLVELMGNLKGFHAGVNDRLILLQEWMKSLERAVLRVVDKLDEINNALVQLPLG